MASCILMRKTLAATDNEICWPDGIALCPWREEHAQSAHALLQQAGQLATTLTVTDWLKQLPQDPEFDPHLCHLACDVHGLAGIAVGWTSTFIRHLAVSPRARGQGLGVALLHSLFATYRQRGEGYVDLKVAIDNHPARRLYASTGMIEVRRYTQ